MAIAARLALLPLEAVYGAVVAARGTLFDAGVLRSQETVLPALSVGNLTVGGTGKTPVAAWFAARLREGGARPAIVLRGYGDDEPLVHATLNPDVPVIATPDRVAGVRAARDGGADVAVLDDAFQHRRARRIADVVLVSADRWDGRRRHLLPAGPWREPLRALRRASLVVVTRKASTILDADEVFEAARSAAPDVPVAVFHIAADQLRAAPGGEGGARIASSLPLRRLAGARTFAISAIGDGGAFHAQLVAAGAILDPPPAPYPDHYAFGPEDATRLARQAERASLVVCTLKDAVKLGPLWPRAAPPLWYVSQRVAPERGADAVDRLLAAVSAARAIGTRDASPSTAGAGRLTDPSHGH